MSEFDEALLYYRGTGTIVREERNPWRLYLRKDRLDVPIFERLFLLLKLKPAETRIAEIMAATQVDRARAARDVEKARAHFPPGVSSDYIYVKIFKRIPQIDIEMLFPNTKVAFRPFDKLKLMVTAGGGTVAGVAGTATKLLAATNPFTLAFGVFGLSAVIFRQAMKFFHTRNHYMMVLAQNLYFCSLANNRGALTLIADGAEEEDVKEDMLLYAFLARHPSKHDALPELKIMVTSFPQGALRRQRQFRRRGRAQAACAPTVSSAPTPRGNFPRSRRRTRARISTAVGPAARRRQPRPASEILRRMMHQASIEAGCAAGRAHRPRAGRGDRAGSGRGRAVRSRTWPLRDLRPLRRSRLPAMLCCC